MLLTLLSSLLGFGSALAPEILKMFQDKKDKAHELEILRLQIQREEKGHAGKLEEIQAESTAAQLLAMSQERIELNKAQRTGVRWVDAFNGTVRPVLAYAFFALYAGLKLFIACRMDWTGMPSVLIVETLWNEEDTAIFASIISFYFGARQVQKLRG